MNVFLGAMRDTLRDVFADRYARTTLLGAIILYSVFYPMAYRHEVAQDLPVVVVDQDHGTYSRQFIRRLDAVRTVRIAGVGLTVEQSRRGLEQGNYEGVVVIPDGFERDITRGDGGHVVLLANGSYLSRGTNVQAALGEVVAAMAADLAREDVRFGMKHTAPAILLIRRPLFNVREGYGSGVVPGVAEVIVHQTLLIGVGVILGGRRQRNGGIQLSYRFKQWVGMMAGFACIGLPAILFYAGFTFWVQDYPHGGNLPGLVLVAPLYIASVLSFALFVGSFFSRREHAFQFVTGASMVLFFLANLTWPVTSAPMVLTLMAKLLPTTAGVNAMVKINQMGASISETLPQIANLVLLTTLYSGLTAWRFRHRTFVGSQIPARTVNN